MNILNSRSRPHLFVVAVLILAFGISGCAKAIAQTPVPHPLSLAQQQPIRIVVFIDQSRSMQQARVARLSPASFGPLVERVEATGGEIAVGLVRDRSDAPLVRLFVPAPPDPPVARSLPANVFAAAAERKRQDDERAKYEQLRRAWRAEATARVNVFATAITPLLAAEDDAPRTDIRSAIVRSNVFLAEPNAYAREPKSAVIFVTDGLDTVNANESPSLSVPAEVLLVNGTGTVGYLERLRPIRFEALDPALRFAVSSEGGRHVQR